MASNSLRRLIASLLLLPMAGSCGVEVGNPHGGKPTDGKTGQVSISLADAPVDRAKHVYVVLSGMKVVPVDADGVDGEPVDVALVNSGKIDVLDLRNGKALDLSLAQDMPVGSYSAVILEFDQAQPPTLIDKDDAERQIPLPDASHKIAVEQAFEVVEGETLDLTVHIDLRRSIREQDDANNPFAFRPFAGLGRRDEAGSIKAPVPDASVTEVCAYLRLGRPGEEHSGGRHVRPPGPPGDRPPPPPGAGVPPGAYKAQPPPRGEHDAPFDPFADDVACDKAFATSGVAEDGTFELHHLWPGAYQLVFYRADGTRLNDTAAEVMLFPGQKIDGDLPPPPPPPAETQLRQYPSKH